MLFLFSTSNLNLYFIFYILVILGLLSFISKYILVLELVQKYKAELRIRILPMISAKNDYTYPTPCPTPYSTTCIPLQVYFTLCVFHSMCIVLYACSTRMCPVMYPFHVCPTPHVPKSLSVSLNLFPAHGSHSISVSPLCSPSRVPPRVRPTPRISLSCVSHSLCASPLCPI